MNTNEEIVLDALYDYDHLGSEVQARLVVEALEAAGRLAPDPNSSDAPQRCLRCGAPASKCCRRWTEVIL